MLEESEFRIHTLFGQKFGLHISYSGAWRPPDAPYDVWLGALGRFLWDQEGSCSWAVYQADDGIESGRDPHTSSLPSETSRKLYETAKLFLDKGYPRSILLYGAPGVGKSHIMHQVRSLVGGFSLRIEAQALTKWAHDCAQLVQILRPDVLLLDDLDRTDEGSGCKGQKVLAFLEEVRDDVRLVLASANFLDEMDPAALRAGRWDDLVEIISLDEEVIDGLIGADVPEEIASRLRNLPVAYIHEFHRRRDVLGMELALESVVGLVAQAAKIDDLCKCR